MNSVPNFLKIQKDKIPKGFSYLFKTSDLIAAYDSAKIEIETILTYSPGNEYLRVDFWPPNPNINHERLYIVVGIVPSQFAHLVRESMKSKILPELIKWVTGLLSLPTNSPRRRQAQSCFWKFKNPDTNQKKPT
ncbi:hypothetical protein [Leptospira santarosai]|uniref:hypothetical protein n=1 Tax=Leptospira santarosai TaxID=28183 RepID=UPI000248B65B|nr:hypothetical protein [Leptospira santarosai]EMM78031.1 hypothetical protein LEP1GSC040_2040 [Leptospira santarosai str. 2000030832]MDI7227795.1 hypothetical protein [Leptospira santarosai]